MRIDCPPKVNLYLRVVRRREDGYHELETVFQSIDGGDTLLACPAAALSLSCSDPELPTDERNLALRAALALRARCPAAANRGAALTLIKRVPVGSGLGGGSADAAGALRLLHRLWESPLPPSVLREIAAELGSDVPFFLLGGTAVARGRGEQLEPVLLPPGRPPLWLVLLTPPVRIATPWAYAHWRPEAAGGPDLETFLAALASGEPERIAATLRNDLEPGVAAAVPEIAAARRWLLEQGLPGARMTGSGSAVFGIARDEAQAREVASRSGAPGALRPARCLTAAEALPEPEPCGPDDPALP